MPLLRLRRVGPPPHEISKMKLAILAVLLVIAALLLAILILLFLPGSNHKAAQPSMRSRQAAFGRAVLEAAQHDPANRRPATTGMGAGPIPDGGAARALSR